MQRNGSLLAEATYDTAGRLATVARTNPGLVAGSTTTYAYDSADRVTGLTTTQGVATLGDFGYTYARGGQVTQATEAIGGTTRTVGYAYDGLGRVSGSTVAFGAGGATTYTYDYDNVGNRTSASVNGVTTQSRSYDAADQVIGWTYDNAGNLLDDGGQTYTWDPLGRLLGVTGGGTSPTYGYTGDGHLLGEASGTTTTRYVLDTAGGLVERLGAVTTSGSATTSAWYSRGPGGELSREAGGGAAQTWYLADRLGSVRAEYDGAAASGLRVDYDPFGVPEAGPGLGAPTDYGFAGEPRDSATGQVHLRARWYRPASGALLGRDPFAGDPAAPQTLNPYAYAHDDPVNMADPTGHFAVALAALTMPGGIVSPLSLVAADAAGASPTGGQVSAGALCAEGPGRTAAPNLPLAGADAPALAAVPDPGVCLQCAGWGQALRWWGVTVRQDEAGAWLEWMLELAFRGIERLSAFLFQSYDGSVFRSGPLQGLILHRDDNVCTDDPARKPGIFQCADARGVFMPNNAWCAGSRDPVREAGRCVRHARLDIQQTTIHELGHYWDAKANWEISRVLNQHTGGRMTPRRQPTPGMICPDPPSDVPANDSCYVPGRGHELPRPVPNQVEDWGEVVAFRSMWDQPRVPGNFLQTWRWHYAKCAADVRASDRVGAQNAAGCAWDRLNPPFQP